FKIVYNDQKWTPVDLANLSDSLLVNHLLNPNEWYSRHARRILQQRAASEALEPQTRRLLRGLLGFTAVDYKGPAWMKRAGDEAGQLRLMWALHVTGGLTENDALILMKSKYEYVRAWTIQLQMEDQNPSPAVFEEFARMAVEDPSPVVRLYLASALQRMPL